MKLFFSILIVVIVGLLYMSMQDPVFMARGSDSLNISALPNSLSQSISLILLLAVFLFTLKLNCFKKPSSLLIKVFLVVFAIITGFVNGHSYTYSGKSHALIDQWFHIPIQTLKIDPTGNISDISYKQNGLFVYVYEKNILRQMILNGPYPWGISNESVIKVLDDIGIVESIRK